MLNKLIGLAAIVVVAWTATAGPLEAGPESTVAGHLVIAGESIPVGRQFVVPHSVAVYNRDEATPLATATAVTPNPQISNLVGAVVGDSLMRYISQLSGHEPVVTGGVLDTLHTRFSFSPESQAATQYLVERLEGFGLDVEVQEFMVGDHHFLGGDFVDVDHGWAVGTAVLRTSDGGLTWQGDSPGIPGGVLVDACRVDALRGWVVGTDAQILHSHDGGATWVSQSAPPGFGAILAVAFVDSLNGWIAGDGGLMARTTDGGAVWTQVPSGTAAPVWDLQFRSANRGWACGQEGVVLIWDGTSWTPQTTGTAETIFDIEFRDDLAGWAAGERGTLLETTDGGLSWTPHATPAPGGTNFTSVCFPDESEGWAVGSFAALLHTSDGGATWEYTYLGVLTNMWRIEFVDSSHGRITGQGCALFRTDDGGATWLNQTQNIPEWAGTWTANVVATIPGSALADEAVIISGHYDSASTEDPMTLAPGADDDASGTAAVLEAARVMAGTHYQRTVRFVCFGGEEQGTQGSAIYAANAARAGDVITAVLDFDQIGYVDQRPEFADILCNDASAWLGDLMVDCGAAYLPSFGVRKFVSSTSVLSDHGPFWLAGYPAITGYSDLPPVNPYYHTGGDTLGNVTKSFVNNLTKVAVATLAELAVPDSVTAGTPGGRDRTSGGAGSISLVTVTPNPFSGTTEVAFCLRSYGKVEAAVFDAGGRRVRTLASGPLSAGGHRLAWDGRDSRGATVQPGVYFVRVEAQGSGERCVKIVNLR